MSVDQQANELCRSVSAGQWQAPAAPEQKSSVEKNMRAIETQILENLVVLCGKPKVGLVF